MKKLILSFIVVSVLFAACRPRTKDAVAFNDRMVAAQKSCIQGEKNFFKACDGFNPDEIKISYVSFNRNIDSSLKIIQEVKEEKEFSSFKENSLMLVSAYKNLISEEYKEYAKIYSLSNDQYTAKDSVRCVEVAEKINSTLNPLVKSFIAEQELFARKWKFILTK